MYKKVTLFYDSANNFMDFTVATEEKVNEQELDCMIPCVVHDSTTVCGSDENSGRIYFDTGIFEVVMFTENEIDEDETKGKMVRKLSEFIYNISRMYDDIYDTLEEEYL